MVAKKKKRILKPRTKAGGTMTEAQHITFVRSALRQKFLRYPPRYQVLKAASRKVVGKKWKTEYQCYSCKDWFKQKEVEVDHIIPCGKFTKFSDLGAYAERLFCEPENLCVLCKPCHYFKTYGKKKGD